MPACRAASTASCASFPCSANGFSQKTCFPAPAAAITCCACSECGVASTTASTPESASSSSYRSTSLSFCASANAVTSGDLVRVAPATNRILSLVPWTASTRVLPHQPRPTIAALIKSVAPIVPAKIQGRPVSGLEPSGHEELPQRHHDHEAVLPR